MKYNSQCDRDISVSVYVNLHLCCSILIKWLAVSSERGCGCTTIHLFQGLAHRCRLVEHVGRPC